MVYNRFYINTIIRIILLFLSCLWLSFCLQKPEYIYTLTVAVSITLIQVILLINYINKTNRELAVFFASLKDKGSSIRINIKNKAGSFKDLAKTLNEVGDLLEKSRVETEKQSKYFEFVVEHIPIGLVSINNNEIVHVNKALLELLQISSLNSLNKLKTVNDKLASEIEKIRPGGQKIIRVKINSLYLQIMVKSTRFLYNKEWLKLVSLQDVKQELEENELISWQKLIRVLTHEIMNSITPISTLTLATKKCLNNEIEARKGSYNENISDALKNIALIEERSESLQNFVVNYKSLTHIRPLEVTTFNINELLENITLLLKDAFEKNNISCNVIIKEELYLEADKKLIEQVLINIIKNSIESLGNSKTKTIHIQSFINQDNRVVITIGDTGAGIPDTIIDQIFMPFYTTKEHGSGIGLSLARQIMRLHKGSISVHSTPSIETVFTLTF